MVPASFGTGVLPVINEKAGGGTDTLLSGLPEIDLDRFANVEHLQLVGSAGLIGRGNAGTNILIGSVGNDTLFGETGDELTTSDLAIGAAATTAALRILYNSTSTVLR